MRAVFAPIAVLIAPLAIMAGCREAPESVLQSARDSLADLNKTSCGDKDRLGDALAAFAQFAEPKSANIIKLAPEVAKRSSGQFNVFVTCKPPPTIIPPGEVSKIDSGDKRTVLILRKPGSKAEVEVPLVLVEGRWKLDLLEMPTFTKAIQLQ